MFTPSPFRFFAYNHEGAFAPTRRSRRKPLRRPGARTDTRLGAARKIEPPRNGETFDGRPAVHGCVRSPSNFTLCASAPPCRSVFVPFVSLAARRHFVVPCSRSSQQRLKLQLYLPRRRKRKHPFVDSPARFVIGANQLKRLHQDIHPETRCRPLPRPRENVACENLVYVLLDLLNGRLFCCPWRRSSFRHSSAAVALESRRRALPAAGRLRARRRHGRAPRGSARWPAGGTRIPRRDFAPASS